VVAEVHNDTDQDHAEQVPGWVLEWHDPRTLLTDKNSRDAKPNKNLIQSITNLGVLEPIIAVRTAEGHSEVRTAEDTQARTVDGRTRVRCGERRTLASIAAGRRLVPVIVTGPEGDGNAEEIARLLGQRAENTYREGMKASEDANTALQLSLYGMNEDDMVEQMLLSRPQIRAAKKLAASKTGAQLIDEHGQLDLITAAKIAKFEDNPERTKYLLHRVQKGWNLDITIQEYEAEDKVAAARAKVRAVLEDQGLRVLDVQPTSRTTDPVRYASDLLDETGKKVDVDKHAGCPGHAMVIEDREVRAKGDAQSTYELVGVVVCDRSVELHPGPPAPPMSAKEAAKAEAKMLAEAAKKDAERAAGRQVRAGNKQWDEAEAGRRDWLKKFLQRKTPPADAMEFLTSEMLLAPYQVTDGFRKGHSLAADLLGVPAGSSVQLAWETMPAPRRAAMQKLGKDVTDKRRTVLLLALVIGGNEKALSRSSWRPEHRKPNEGCPQREYLRFIINHGYPACTVERMAAGLKIDSAEFEALEPAKIKAAQVTDKDEQKARNA
jgi:ParB family chromosome partitioning protein